ncbi:type II secretion system protein [Stutzerimonas nitrititolerans]|uniref:type II secretion system protein n=1 Tax=Stutzerimonas nitrititolerans TaxID=2482751 RepID=UPI0028A060A1|nr:type II secretion system protein [Stutzerimonas nitrititolerans]
MVEQRGFTIVELIMVIVILGIISAVALPRFFDRKTFDERFYFEEVLSSVRYGQKLAVASGCLVNVKINNSGYALAYGAGACSGIQIKDPSDKSYPIKPPSNVSIQSGMELEFNSLGCITSDSSVNCSSGNNTVTVGNFSFRVHAATGFIEVIP